MRRILTYSLFLIPCLAFGQSLQIVLTNSIQSFTSITKTISTDPCVFSEEIVKPSNCEDIPHCAVDPNKYESFCFNGEKVEDEGGGANKLMMTFLCTNNDFPPLPDTGISFGSCEGVKEILTYREDGSEILCHCDSNVFKCLSILKEI